MTSINANRLLSNLRTLGAIGRDTKGRLTRLAATDEDRRGRDRFAGWVSEAGLELKVDRVGNMFAIWNPPENPATLPLLIGSHIDTVIDAGALDGCYGVLAGLEVVQTLKEIGLVPSRPVVVAAFTNEEGVRFTPDMGGSAVFAGVLAEEEMLAARAADGALLCDELKRIGYAGEEAPGFFRPAAYIEIHIEQGPVLEREGISIGVVEGVQGISWQQIVVTGEANHAGTTPMAMRHDAGHAAARIVNFLHDLAACSSVPLVANVGTLSLSPNAINVVPGGATLTVDMRSPDEERLVAAEQALANFLDELAHGGFDVELTRLVRTTPVRFDPSLADRIASAASGLGLSTRRMTSGAGHDAQMIAPIAPTSMIFVPSIGGISHNPREATSDGDLIAGANVLLKTVEAWLTSFDRPRSNEESSTAAELLFFTNDGGMRS